jgi:hypothetical protein
MGNEAFEIVPDDEPFEIAVFMKDVGPRTLLIGHACGLHLAYDLGRGRLARTWKGRFFNAAGTWENRAGALEEPAGSDVLSWPKGPSLARLKSPDEAWPLSESKGVATRVMGRSYDLGRHATFHLLHDGIQYDEQLTPVETGETLALRWQVSRVRHEEKGSLHAIYWRIATGQHITLLENGVSLSDRQIKSSKKLHVVQRPNGLSDVLMEIAYDPSAAIHEVKITW